MRSWMKSRTSGFAMSSAFCWRPSVWSSLPRAQSGWARWMSLSGLIISGSNQRPKVIPSACTWSMSGPSPSGYLRGSTSQSESERVSSSRIPNQPSSRTKRSAPSRAARVAMSRSTGSEWSK